MPLISKEERAADEAVIAKATPGPWYGSDILDNGNLGIITDDNRIVGGYSLNLHKNDADFIAAARTRWPAYVEALREAEARIRELEFDIGVALPERFDDALRDMMQRALTVTDEENEREVSWSDVENKFGESTRPKTLEMAYLFGRAEAILAIDSALREIFDPDPKAPQRSDLRAENAKLKAALEELSEAAEQHATVETEALVADIRAIVERTKESP